MTSHSNDSLNKINEIKLLWLQRLSFRSKTERDRHFQIPTPKKNDNIFFHNEHYLYIIWEIIIDDDEHDNRFDR